MKEFKLKYPKGVSTKQAAPRKQALVTDFSGLEKRFLQVFLITLGLTQGGKLCLLSKWNTEL